MEDPADVRRALASGRDFSVAAPIHAGGPTKGVTAMPAIKRLSPSAIDRYRSCPRQFQLRDLVGVPLNEQRSPALAIGNAVHAALALFHRLDSSARDTEAIHRCLRSKWREHTAGVFSSEAEERTAGLTWLDHLAHYAACREASVAPTAVESWIRLRIAGVDVVGRADRVEPLDDGLRVVDYKTGRCRLLDQDLPGETAAIVYALGAQAAFGKPTRCVSYLYLAEHTEISWHLEDDDLEEAGRWLTAHLHEIAADREFEPLPGEACRFCHVRDHCPDADRVRLSGIAVPNDLCF
jgi:putative RecB family exonuclease